MGAGCWREVGGGFDIYTPHFFILLRNYATYFFCIEHIVPQLNCADGVEKIPPCAPNVTDM